ncbi:PIN domain-containing protein [Microbacterium protaetiae]|uniref:Ribonuclease VapC n=1 Tax=Microbacterium protaetiae TaxID=2509458 RepID=A0A4P6EHD7_9MICO|nr:type II toxin-antitoxin system VapC family toxin [Microbacterium protaetiae]QAY59517.1 PIN domain-containing protein [Microbacterium protaetiae]
MRAGPDADAAELVVVDASAIVAVTASRSAVASALTDRLSATKMFAPHLLPTEVDSALRGLALRRRLTPEQADAARRATQALLIELWPWALLSDRAWQLRENLSTYDAGYVALAEYLGAPLITGDARIARAPHVPCRVEVFG